MEIPSMTIPFRPIAATVLCSLLLLPQVPARAHDHEHDHDHPVEGLIELPHPMRVIDRPHWKQRLSDEQKAAIIELRSKTVPRYLGLMGQAFPLEQALRNASIDFADAKPSNLEKLQELAELKRQMSEVQIEAYARLKAILGKALWHDLMKELQASGPESD
jgi:transposase-like protein